MTATERGTGRTLPARSSVRDEVRVVGSWRAAWLRVEGLWTWYRRYWRSNLYSSGIQPLLYLMAMGIGFGSQVERGTLPYDVSYVQYVAPALLVVGAVQFAVGESTYPVLSGFKWEKSYLAVTATPISPGQLVGGHLIWVALRVVLAAVVYVVVAAFFGAWTGPGVLVAAVVGIVTGLACAAPITAFAATTTNDARFATLFRFGVIPMILFAGTFFPVEQIPEGVRWLAWISPLWHGNELARGAALGGLGPGAALGHLAVLAAVFAMGAVLARHYFYRRLVV